MQNASYDVLKLNIPKDCLAIQAGEVLQILSGGTLIALPHTVVVPRVKEEVVTRNAFALFMDCNLDTVLDVPKGVSA